MESFLKCREMKENYVVGAKKKKRELDLEEENIIESDQKPVGLAVEGESVLKFVYCTPDQDDKEETPLKHLDSKEPLH